MIDLSVSWTQKKGNVKTSTAFGIIHEIIRLYNEYQIIKILKKILTAFL